MKSSGALFLTSLGLVAAQANILKLQSQIPECALECIAEGAAMFDCEVTDLECSCSQLGDITQEVAPCAVKAGCGMKEITDAATIVHKICEEIDEFPTNDTVSTLDDDNNDSEDSTTKAPEPTVASAAAMACAQQVGLVFIAVAAGAALW